MTLIFLAWLAGLLEGEAYFGAARSSPGSPVIRLGMTDRDVVMKVGAAFKAKTYLVPRRARENRKDYHQVALCGRTAAGLMMTLYPFLGMRRRQRVRELLKAWRSARAGPKYGPICRNGHLLSGENLTIEQQRDGPRRRCEICREAARVRWRDKQQVA